MFVAAGSAAAAATKERIVASFIVAARWLAGHAEPVLGTANFMSVRPEVHTDLEQNKVQRRHLSVSKQLSP